jgi:glutamate racemase
MDNRPILFLDSGIGGLPYLRHFQLRNPREKTLYAADRRSFPYGSKEKDELVSLLIRLIEGIETRFTPKLAALVCNTASVSALGPLRERFPRFPWVGTVPALKPALLASRTRHVGLLGTPRTIEDPYVGELAARYGPDCALSLLAAPELVDFVEYRYALAGPGERRAAVEPYVAALRQAGADGVVLGCTHFLFLRDEFEAAAGAGMGIYDSVEGVSRRIEALLDQGDLRAGGGEGSPAGEGLLLLTGAGAPGAAWEEQAARFGLRLCRWEGAGGLSPGTGGP